MQEGNINDALPTSKSHTGSHPMQSKIVKPSKIWIIDIAVYLPLHDKVITVIYP